MNNKPQLHYPPRGQCVWITQQGYDDIMRLWQAHLTKGNVPNPPTIRHQAARNRKARERRS